MKRHWLLALGALAMLGAWVIASYVGFRVFSEEKFQRFGNPLPLFIEDDTLGVRPSPGFSTSAEGFFRGKQIYDVIYTFDEDGLRVSPPIGAHTSEDCVLFFGDSYTFGEGVDDDEAMPYRVGARSLGRYRIRNFAFFDYGPHQMLAAIESGRVERHAHCKPRYAIFQTKYHHVVRAAGLWTGDRHGPHYTLAADGRAVRDGNFDSEAPSSDVVRALDESAVATEPRKRSMEAGAGDATEEDVKLYRAIVEESRRRLEQIWPGIEFHVIFWDVYEAQGRWPLFEESRSEEGLTVHPISKILPPADDPERVYKLGDGVHPNARADDLIAAYIVRNILHLSGG